MENAMTSKPQMKEVMKNIFESSGKDCQNSPLVNALRKEVSLRSSFLGPLDGPFTVFCMADCWPWPISRSRNVSTGPALVSSIPGPMWGFAVASAMPLLGQVQTCKAPSKYPLVTQQSDRNKRKLFIAGTAMQTYRRTTARRKTCS